MSELPSEDALIRHQEALKAQIKRIERQRTSQKMMKVMMGAFNSVNSKIVPEITAGPTAQVRKSVLALEESHGNFEKKLLEVESRYDSMLEIVRRRTILLRNWLEAL